MSSDQVSLLGGGYAYASVAGGRDELVRLSLSSGMQQGMDSSLAAKLTPHEAEHLASVLVDRARQARRAAPAKFEGVANL